MEPDLKKPKLILSGTTGENGISSGQERPVSPPSNNDQSDQAMFMSDYSQEDDMNGAIANKGYEILTAETIFINMIKLIQQTNEIIKLPSAILMMLFNHVKWDRDRLLEAFYEDEEKLLKDADVIIPTEISTKILPSIGATIECNICLETVAHDKTSAMICGHRFCKECWSMYLKSQVMNEGTSQTISCPASKCSTFVEYEMIKAHVTDETVIRRYQHLVANNFVESNRRMRWCPAAGCSNAVAVEVVKWDSVTCSCGNCFCFLCGKDWHEPIKCDLLVRWLKKCSDDSETSTWMQANTKDCPKCSTMIEKNGGCNHMTCRMKSCQYQFCWICMKDWSSHNGDAYNCNRFDESKNKEAGEARISLKRYLHYYERYMSHMQSLQFETKLKDTINDKMDLFQKELKMSKDDLQFFVTAAQTLCRCRRTLMYTYGFAFFLTKSNQSEMFEDNQRDLESATEALSGYLENDLSDRNDDGVKVDPVQIKRQIVDSSAYCESRRVILNQHVLDGYDDKFWSYRENETTA